jgi:hypothetical protein
MMTIATSITERRSQMSATAPAGIDNSMTGKALAPCTKATISDERVKDTINHAAPTVCTRVPILDKRLANQSDEKIPLFNGASADKTQDSEDCCTTLTQNPYT